MRKIRYIEIRNSTGEITDVSPYRSSYTKHIDVIGTLDDKTYTGFIIDIDKYIKLYSINRPKSIPRNVHNFVLTNNRKNKIKRIKTRINGSSI